MLKSGCQIKTHRNSHIALNQHRAPPASILGLAAIRTMKETIAIMARIRLRDDVTRMRLRDDVTRMRSRDDEKQNCDVGLTMKMEKC